MSSALRFKVTLLTLALAIISTFAVIEEVHARAARYDRRIIGLFGLGGRFMSPLNLQTSADTIGMSASAELQLGMILQHFEIYGLYSSAMVIGSGSAWGGGFKFRILDSGPYNTHEGVLVPKFALKLALEYVKISPAINDPSKTVIRYGLGTAFRSGETSFIEFSLMSFSLGKINIAPYLGFHFAFRSNKK